MLRYWSWGGITFSGWAFESGVGVATVAWAANTGVLAACGSVKLVDDFRLCIVILFPWILSPLPLSEGGKSGVERKPAALRASIAPLPICVFTTRFSCERKRSRFCNAVAGMSVPKKTRPINEQVIFYHDSNSNANNLHRSRTNNTLATVGLEANDLHARRVASRRRHQNALHLIPHAQHGATEDEVCAHA